MIKPPRLTKDIPSSKPGLNTRLTRISGRTEFMITSGILATLGWYSPADDIRTDLCNCKARYNRLTQHAVEQ